MATHSSILAWRIPWTEEPGGLQSMGPQRQDHVTNTNAIYMCVYLSLSNSVVFIAWGEYSGHTLSTVAHRLSALLVLALAVVLVCKGCPKEDARLGGLEERRLPLQVLQAGIGDEPVSRAGLSPGCLDSRLLPEHSRGRPSTWV